MNTSKFKLMSEEKFRLESGFDHFTPPVCSHFWRKCGTLDYAILLVLLLLSGVVDYSPPVLLSETTIEHVRVSFLSSH